MGKRFAIVIAVAAAGVMALGAQTGAAAPDVVKYDTKLTITQDRTTQPYIFLHGNVRSAVRKCEVWRRVAVFKQQPGPDRKLGEGRSSTGTPAAAPGRWLKKVPQAKDGWRVYARVRREVRPDRFVCRGARSPIYTMTASMR